MMAAWRFGFAANASAHIQCFDTGSPGVMIGLHGFCQNSWPRHVFTAPIPSHFFSFPVMIWWIALSAAAKVGFSRRLRHGHRMYVTTPPAASCRHAYFLIERWPVHCFLAHQVTKMFERRLCNMMYLTLLSTHPDHRLAAAVLRS